MDYKARFYSPYITQFSQPDTITPDQTNPQALNRYSYVLDSPINLNDPTGHCPVCIIALFGLAIALSQIPSDVQHDCSSAQPCGDQAVFEAGATIYAASPELAVMASEGLMGLGSLIRSPRLWAAGYSISNANQAAAETVTIGRNNYVSISPSKYDSSIDSEGLLLQYSQERPRRIWLTTLDDVADVNDAEAFETILYKKSLWSAKSGSYESGATVRSVDTSMLAEKPIRAGGAGIANSTNGVRQWYLTQDVPPSALKTIRRIQ